MVTYVTLHISTITVDTMHTNKIDFTAVLSVWLEFVVCLVVRLLLICLYTSVH